MDRQKLLTLKTDLEYYDTLHSHIASLPREVKALLVDVLTWWKQESSDEYDIEDCMNEKIWCSIDWIDYILDNMKETESED